MVFKKPFSQKKTFDQGKALICVDASSDTEYLGLYNLWSQGEMWGYNMGALSSILFIKPGKL